jgi:hypothetical protein
MFSTGVKTTEKYLKFKTAADETIRAEKDRQKVKENEFETNKLFQLPFMLVVSTRV